MGKTETFTLHKHNQVSYYACHNTLKLELYVNIMLTDTV